MAMLKFVKDFFFPNRVSTNEWLGEYRYGEMYSTVQQANTYKFKIYLNFESEKVSGSIYEIVNNEPKSMPILGEFDGKNFYFNINRNEKWTVAEEDSTLIEEGVAQIVTYRGVFDAKNNSFAGDWEIINRVRPYSNAPEIEYIAKGKWRIFKK
jgi:hypothetical protein